MGPEAFPPPDKGLPSSLKAPIFWPIPEPDENIPISFITCVAILSRLSVGPFMKQAWH